MVGVGGIKPLSTCSDRWDVGVLLDTSDVK